MKKLLITLPIVASLGFAGCSRVPDIQGNVVNTQAIIDTAQGLAQTFCGILPLASVIGQIIAASAGAGPIEIVAAGAAHAFCDAIPEDVKAQLRARHALRGAAPVVQGALQNFGTVIINGKPIALLGYPL